RPNYEFATETREELIYNNDKLLQNCERSEAEHAANIAADAPKPRTAPGGGEQPDDR
ncbi:MAG: hypothetical protein JNL25_12520, partial [Rhodospirillaceae bacterium]|nr:hypothetical protein [Rhodospirillaceae bacterium]